uniref:Transient receptor potential cation channel subfamily V member 1-like n=1 Tax=Sphaeramia orbicularis TaxID=375764 RepID=A0A673BAZ0_9TELE
MRILAFKTNAIFGQVNRQMLINAELRVFLLNCINPGIHFSHYTKTDYPDHTERFTKEKLFKAACEGDSSQLDGLLDYLKANNKKLTSSEFKDESNGQTALLKALLHLKDQKNDTIPVFLDIAEKTEDLEAFINASYKGYFNGQTALHIAIERRSLEHVKLLVQKEADVQAKANGKFFQSDGQPGFYFGELPLSLAACTNQPEVVSFLMDNPYKTADVTDKDSQGNTVLHALVILADNKEENTKMITQMYDDILVQHYKLEKKKKVQLDTIENNQGLTPLKLAAKLGKIGLFRHIMHQEFLDKETRPLSMKVAEWVYGPVQSSLYNIDSIDTDKDNSVLEILVYGREIPNRTDMLKIEPLHSLLKDKWNRFAGKLFFTHFLIYVAYLAIFTGVAIYRKAELPPYPIKDVYDYLRSIGELICVIGAVWFLCKGVYDLKRNRPKFNTLYISGFSDIMFFFQGLLLLIAAILYICGVTEYLGLLVISQALAWVNILYFTRGNKQLGIYNVMVQRMILGDIFNFLFVYAVFLFGFTTVDPLSNITPAGYISDVFCNKQSYTNICFTIMELSKFTIGMGNLEFADKVHHKEVFYILLITYIILTYILLLNMLIALMGNTVETTSSETEKIWNLQVRIDKQTLEDTGCIFIFISVFFIIYDGICKSDSRYIFR